MQIKKYRWSKDYESSEEELMIMFNSTKIEPLRWVGAEQEIFSSHDHVYNKKLWCAEGSIKFVVSGQTFSLQPGDGLDLPANTEHSAIAGISGCVCYEQQLQV